MWQAKIKQLGRVKNVLQVVVSYFEDGEEGFEETYTTSVSPSQTWIEDLIQSKLRDLIGIEAFKQKLAEGAVVGKTVASIKDEEEILVNATDTP